MIDVSLCLLVDKCSLFRQDAIPLNDVTAIQTWRSEAHQKFQYLKEKSLFYILGPPQMKPYQSKCPQYNQW